VDGGEHVEGITLYTYTYKCTLVDMILVAAAVAVACVIALYIRTTAEVMAGGGV